MLILVILFIVVMFLWLLTILPVPPLQQFHASNVFFAFIAVLLLGLIVLLPVRQSFGKLSTMWPISLISVAMAKHISNPVMILRS